MRRPIALFATSGLLPLVALGAIFGTVALRNQRQAVEGRAHSHANFAATLIADRLADERAQVAMIAQSPAFDGKLDETRFRLLAARILAQQPAWRTLSVADPAGERLIDVPAPIGGQPHGPVVDRISLARAVASARPDIGEVVAGPKHGLAFAIRAPVVRDGRVRAVVSAVVPSISLNRLLRFQTLPDGWRAGLVDGTGIIVASAVDAAPDIGKPATAEALQARRGGAAGPYAFTRRSGDAAVGVYAPVAGTRWTVHVTAPASIYSGPLRQALLLAAAATILCLLLFLALVRLLFVELRQSRREEAVAFQVQRMEALGRLTGGIAHDLNNLLTPIVGGLDLLRRRITDDARALRHIDLAQKSAERARILVGRLLSFSRRQTLAPQDIEVDRLLAGLSDLLERSLTPAIALNIMPSAERPIAHADPAQFELAILNLAINARDAMPEGGTLTIGARPAAIGEAQGLAPGRYVTVYVADTGTGMSAETLRHATDPFFTTKSGERGTGLGLSMVHGFAGQSGGTLLLRSEEGEGTEARIVLPAGEAAPVEREASAPPPERVIAPKHILVVDDDEAVRVATSEMLETAGHRATSADGVDRALALLAEGTTFDGVVTDYLMPGRSGAELIGALADSHPALPVMLMTGYIGSDDPLPQHVVRLRKPFDARELLDSLDNAIALARR